METVKIDLGERTYSIYLGQHLLNDANILAPYLPGESVAVVTNTTVNALYFDRIEKMMRLLNKRMIPIVLPDGEQYKDWQTLNLIFDALLKHRADRHTVLLALGGGVIGDMTGFAAACYMRGVPFIQIPTTLLAQVDSSVGGKTGINHPLGKNMIGAFYQPKVVLADSEVLKTLPARELSAGVAEIIKTAAIADQDFFVWLEDNIEALLAYDSEVIVKAVKRCCEIKANIVALDEKESGVRAILNFGHTFGHAIEAGLGFGKWLHGEAVGYGMLMAANLSHRLGLLSEDDQFRIQRLIERVHLSMYAPKLTIAQCINLMKSDKKSYDGVIQFVVLNGLGQAQVQSVDESLLIKTLERFLN